MFLWMAWWDVVWQLRSGFSRSQSFLWAAMTIMGFCIRRDMYGIASFVRCLGLKPRYYRSLREFFHSTAIHLKELTSTWCHVVLKIFDSNTVRFKGRIVLIADGVKNPKEGRKMPAVKLVHQESNNNSKPEFVMAHSCQCISLLVKAVGTFFSVPLAGRIHEGIKFSNRDHRSLIDKLLALILELQLPAFYLTADAYYACRGLIQGLLQNGHHLISRVRSNAVAYEPAPRKAKPGRGRPRTYGAKVKLRSVFKQLDIFQKALSPLYDDQNIKIQYAMLELIWRPLGKLVRFVWVIHPSRGKWILISTDLRLTPLEIIELYGLRFKIEVMFRQAIHQILAPCAASPLRRGESLLI